MPKSGHAITARSRPESVNGRGSGVQGGKWPFAGRRAPPRRATVAPSAGNGADQRAIRRRCARDKRQKREKAAGWAILQQTNASDVFTLYKPQPPRYYSPRSHDSSVVQSVERRTVNPYVTGSSPVRGAIFREARSGKPERVFCYSARRESDIFGVAAVQVVPSAEPQGKAENKDQKIQHIRHNQRRMYA